MAKKEQAKHGESADLDNEPVTAAEDTTPKRNNAKELAEFKKTANHMKDILASQPKVRIYVPLENGEPKGTQLPVEINGYRMNVPKGVPNVEVPEAVADIIWKSLGIYDEASAALRSENEPSRPLRLDLQKEEDRNNLEPNA